MRLINHSKIVRHFDTIEIDNNSFCTVLEYCSGPDLATYLQRNRFIQEKEARIIITQILEGLEYLNKLPNEDGQASSKLEGVSTDCYKISNDISSIQVSRI